MIETGAGAHGGGPSVGLPSRIRACLFDLDGVLAQTATLHAAAWKTMFDGFLRARAAQTGDRFVPFDLAADYAEYVEGKPRIEGVRSFLAARRIELPEGRVDDPHDTETINALANRKNELILALIREHVPRRCPGGLGLPGRGGGVRGSAGRGRCGARRFVRLRGRRRSSRPGAEASRARSRRRRLRPPRAAPTPMITQPAPAGIRRTSSSTPPHAESRSARELRRGRALFRRPTTIRRARRAA